ncbi:MAG: hypothetical protein RB294_08855 [Bacteroidales bacterium]|jgi:hypothetical protein|nr:hypothetical protein [Bacteroidales bacterium]HPB01329.1 hypothetical protein [Bacteroidales bacterium]
MKTLKRNTGLALLKLVKVFPARSAVAGIFIALAALLTTTTSCEPQVMCYDPAPPDTIPQDTVDSTRQTLPTDIFENTDEKR